MELNARPSKTSNRLSSSTPSNVIGNNPPLADPSTATRATQHGIRLRSLLPRRTIRRRIRIRSSSSNNSRNNDVKGTTPHTTPLAQCVKYIAVYSAFGLADFVVVSAISVVVGAECQFTFASV